MESVKQRTTGRKKNARRNWNDGTNNAGGESLYKTMWNCDENEQRLNAHSMANYRERVCVYTAWNLLR